MVAKVPPQLRAGGDACQTHILETGRPKQVPARAPGKQEAGPLTPSSLRIQAAPTGGREVCGRGGSGKAEVCFSSVKGSEPLKGNLLSHLSRHTGFPLPVPPPKAAPHTAAAGTPGIDLSSSLSCLTLAASPSPAEQESTPQPSLSL